jgi:hypothetical protein
MRMRGGPPAPAHASQSADPDQLTLTPDGARNTQQQTTAGQHECSTLAEPEPALHVVDVNDPSINSK